MYTQKPLLTSVATAILTMILVAGLATIYWWERHFTSLQVNLSDVWEYVWTLGLIAPGNGCSIDISCRLQNMQSIFEIPAIKWHLIAIALASITGGTIAFWYKIRHVPLRETVQTIQGTRLLYDSDGRGSIRAKLKRDGKAEKNSLWLMPYVQLTRAAESFYMILLGDHGSGKTGILRGWLEQILQHDYRLVIHLSLIHI